MSQTATAQPPPQPQAGGAGAGGATGHGAASSAPAAPTPQILGGDALTHARGIPARLSQWRLLVVLALLACTVLTSAQLALSWQALRTASSDTQQLIRVQGIKVDLLRADALATNAFLVGGLEAPTQRAAYDQALADATTALSAAAQAQGADQGAIAELSDLVVRYAANMEVARANNRQGLPVGAAYLRTASNELRGRGMVVVDALIDANSTRAQRSLANQHPVWMLLPPLLTLALLAVANQWIATRFRRRFNVGLVLAGGLILAVALTATALSALQSRDNSTLSSTTYADVVTGADARSAASAAKSNESLRLIARGSGASFEKAWTQESEAVVSELQDRSMGDLQTLWSTYTQGHQQIVAKDDGGDWDGAVALATSRDSGSASVAFEAFDQAAATSVRASATVVEDRLSQRQTFFLALAAAVVLAGLAAMGLAWRGVTRRLEEYS